MNLRVSCFLWCVRQCLCALVLVVLVFPGLTVAKTLDSSASFEITIVPAGIEQLTCEIKNNVLTEIECVTEGIAQLGNSDVETENIGVDLQFVDLSTHFSEQQHDFSCRHVNDQSRNRLKCSMPSTSTVATNTNALGVQ